MDSVKSFLHWFIWPVAGYPTKDGIDPFTPEWTATPDQHIANPSEQKSLKDIVTLHEDLKYVNPIKYAYDPVPAVTSYLSPVPLQFTSQASWPCSRLRENSTRVHPFRGGLPYRSSLNHVRACKHFEANILESTELLEKIMTERSAADVPVGAAGITLGKLAKHELRPGIADRMSLATTYMFPAADEKRLRIIAVLMIMYFIFDDKVEECPEGDPLNDFRTDFFSHFDVPTLLTSEPKSDFRRHTRRIMQEIWEEDAIAGNGGKEMVEALRDAFRRVHPEGEFKSMEEYLQFRRLNVGARFVIAGAKFTIQSSVDVKDPRFARYLALIGDHLGIINDMASYDKELRALQNGDTEDMINFVAVVKNLMSLPTEDAAKAAAYAHQLQIEAWIMEEIERLGKEESLTDEEWWFLEAVLLTATGNTFFCMISSRYGGQAAAIEAAW